MLESEIGDRGGGYSRQLTPNQEVGFGYVSYSYHACERASEDMHISFDLVPCLMLYALFLIQCFSLLTFHACFLRAGLAVRPPLDAIRIVLQSGHN